MSSLISQKIIQFIYQLLLPLMLIVLAPGQVLKMIRRKDTTGSIVQRLGFFSHLGIRTLAAKKNGLWIHAVSVGEVNIAVRLIREWLKRYPSLPILLTTTTNTGYAVAQNQLGSTVGILFNPIDFLPVVRKFLKLLQPRLIVLVESELWPNCIWEAERQAIPVALVNARVSRRSEKRYRLFLPIIKPLYEKISIICAQNENDAERLIRLGARPESLRVVDSMKFDVSEVHETKNANIYELLQQAGFPSDAIILLGGSTHPGEEEILSDIYRDLAPAHPKLRLVLVPRHFERCNSLARRLGKKGFRVVLKKQILKTAKKQIKETDILIVDTTGELKHFYSISHITFVGKSLLGRGGQNFLEPVQFCHPVIVGPHMDNFSELTAYFLKNDALIQVRDAKQLKTAITRCLQDPKYGEKIASNAVSLFHRRLGATGRTILALDPLVTAALPNN